jgi:AcrR family transcriptional regulator
MLFLRTTRPPSEMAASHGVIMDAVYALLQEKSVRDLTMEAVAKRARVGKPTLYKWRPTKATLALAIVCERMAPKLEKPTVLSAEESLRFSSAELDRRVQRAVRQNRGRADRRGPERTIRS